MSGYYRASILLAFGEYIAEEVGAKGIAYIYGVGLLGQLQNGKAYNYFTNGQADIVYMQDPENELMNYYAYDACGNRIEAIRVLNNEKQ